MSTLPFPFPVGSTDILSRRAEILTALCASDGGFCRTPVASVRQETLTRMLRLYDELFLAGLLGRKLPVLCVTLSSRLTSSAGKFICVRGPFGRIKEAEIRMSSDFLLRLNDGPFDLNGLSVSTPQEAFLVVFEHELCHALETVLFGQTGHSQRFLSLAHGLFGHTATRHKLPTRRQAAAQDGLIVGKTVSFSYQGKRLTGFITYIGKTATVMVPSPVGEYRDTAGRRYVKYRVPLSKLQITP